MDYQEYHLNHKRPGYIYRKFRTSLFQPFARMIKKKVTAADRNKCKLVMTLLVKDEEDIIRQNIEFHLAQGVDFIMATDNGSVDCTLDILKEYEKKGVLYLIEEPSGDYLQTEWVQRMAELAYNRFNADLLFHCDADEFWRAASGNLKNELLAHPFVRVLNAGLRNVLLEYRGGAERFPEDAKYQVINPYPKKDIQKNAEEETRLYLCFYPGAVLFRTGNKLPKVIGGNHDVIDRKTYFRKSSEDILIYHYPLRGRTHFYRKILNGCKVVENKGKNISAYWRRWYRAYQDGRLEGEYRNLVLDKTEADELIKRGVVAEENEMRQILRTKVRILTRHSVDIGTERHRMPLS